MKRTFFNFLIIFIIFFNLLASADEIRSIKIMGNERISKETILLFSKISKNSKITNKNQLNDIFKNLYETNFFSDIKVNFKNNVLTITMSRELLMKSSFDDIKNEWKRLIKLGTGGICTDHPNELKMFLSEELQ